MFNAFTVVIQGKVQGVGFRYFTKNKADELDLRGWVRNLPDGGVEVLAIGDKPLLEQFMQSLKAGPIGSRVENTQFQWYSETQELSRFEIRG
jgi:acylphosphatase